MPVLPDPLSRDALDFQLSPSRSAKDAMGVLQRHVAQTAALAQAPGLRVTRDIAYGTAPRQRMDICRPEAGGDLPCLVFIHGGFWQEGSKEGSGFAAAAWAAAGWAHVGIGYTLAPEASLTGIVAEIARALVTLRRIAPDHGIDPDRLVLAGHSAGGHLAAAMMAGLGGPEAAAALAGAVLISGVYELDPIAASYVNEAVGMTGAEVAALSPMRLSPVHDIPTLVLIGADEPGAFQWQSDTLARLWQPQLSDLTFLPVPGRDHFDILDTLAEPDGPVMPAIRALLP